MKKVLKKLWARYKVGLQNEFEYRWASLIWIINQWVGTLFVMFLWYFAAKNVPGFSMTPSQVITYFILSVPVSRLTQTWLWENMGNDIRSGGLTKFLLRPQPYLFNELAENFSTQTVRLLTLLPVLLLVWYSLRGDFVLSLTLGRLIPFVLALGLGFVTRFVYEGFMGLSTFWLLDVYGFAAIMGNFSGLFTGANIPLSIMPPFLYSLAKLLPFRFFVSFPLEIILGQMSGPQIFWGFSTGVVWILVFVFLYRSFYVKGLKKYEAVGI